MVPIAAEVHLTTIGEIPITIARASVTARRGADPVDTRAGRTLGGIARKMASTTVIGRIGRLLFAAVGEHAIAVTKARIAIGITLACDARLVAEWCWSSKVVSVEQRR